MGITKAVDTNDVRPRMRWLLILPVAAVWGVVPGLSPFETMCGISLSLYGLIKLHVLTHYVGSHKPPSQFETLEWFLTWPGLDAKAFFRVIEMDPPGRPEWLFAVLKTLFGVAVLFLLAPALYPARDLIIGWVAFVGIVFILHFGLFHIAALFWRSRGRDVRPIMIAPILSTSVSEFWSHRWNRAFRDFASPFLFIPLARRTSPTVAVLSGYAFSGLVHELAISVPAGAGYGLPTLYFAIQGVAIVTERAVEKRGWQLTGGPRGWFWTAMVTAPGAFLLFHPPFIRRVVLPMADYIRHFAV